MDSLIRGAQSDSMAVALEQIPRGLQELVRSSMVQFLESGMPDKSREKQLEKAAKTAIHAVCTG